MYDCVCVCVCIMYNTYMHMHIHKCYSYHCVYSSTHVIHVLSGAILWFKYYCLASMYESQCYNTISIALHRSRCCSLMSCSLPLVRSKLSNSLSTCLELCACSIFTFSSLQFQQHVKLFYALSSLAIFLLYKTVTMKHTVQWWIILRTINQYM